MEAIDWCPGCGAATDVAHAYNETCSYMWIGTRWTRGYGEVGPDTRPDADEAEMIHERAHAGISDPDTCDRGDSCPQVKVAER